MGCQDKRCLSVPVSASRVNSGVHTEMSRTPLSSCVYVYQSVFYAVVLRDVAIGCSPPIRPEECTLPCALAHLSQPCEKQSHQCKSAVTEGNGCLNFEIR